MMRSPPVIAFALTLALALLIAGLGCATTDFIPPNQVARLDGFNAQDAPQSARPIETLDGHKLTFTPGTSLYLNAVNVPKRPAGGRFTSIHVQDDVFTGTTVDGREVEVPLSNVRSARIEQPVDLRATAIVGSILGCVVLSGATLWYWSRRPGGSAETVASP